jgi:hypothetical protein
MADLFAPLVQGQGFSSVCPNSAVRRSPAPDSSQLID